MEVLQGFKHKGRTVLFMDAKGKDAGTNRYRIVLYYAIGKAETHFLPTVSEYYSFLYDYCPVCYESYGEFRQRKTNEQAIEETKTAIQDAVIKLNNLHSKLNQLGG